MEINKKKKPVNLLEKVNRLDDRSLTIHWQPHDLAWNREFVFTSTGRMHARVRMLKREAGRSRGRIQKSPLGEQ